MTDVEPKTAGTEDGIVLTKEQQRRRRSRSVALGLVLVALCVLFYVVTVYKLGANVVESPI